MEGSLVKVSLWCGRYHEWKLNGLKKSDRAGRQWRGLEFGVKRR
jgi:hypothetical protein